MKRAHIADTLAELLEKAGFGTQTLFFGQTNFAKAPSINITSRFQLLGFDECFDPACYKTEIRIPRLFNTDGCGDVGEDAGNLEKLPLAARQDGLIDQVR